MLSTKTWRKRGRSERARRRLEPTAREALEGRELLSFSPLGFSLPDLTVTGYAAPVAAWGNPLAVTVDVRNIGSSSLTEPLALQYGSPSGADSAPSSVSVYVSRRPHFGPGAIKVGSLAFPAIRQNSLAEETALVNLPQQPRGFPGNGGTFFVEFRVDENRTLPDRDRTNNTSKAVVPVQIAVALPDLFAIALDVPPVMQPGDVIQPNIKIANYGTADPAAQGSFEVDLVASTEPNFGPGSQILSRFTVTSLPPLSDVPSTHTVLGDVNIQDPFNVLTLQGAPTTLPASATGYFLGVIVDPQNKIRQIHEIGVGPSSALSPVVKVGNPIAGLPPAGVVTSPPPPQSNVFPFPANGTIQSLLHPENSTLLTNAQAGGSNGAGSGLGGSTTQSFRRPGHRAGAGHHPLPPGTGLGGSGASMLPPHIGAGNR